MKTPLLYKVVNGKLYCSRQLELRFKYNPAYGGFLNKPANSPHYSAYFFVFHNESHTKLGELLPQRTFFVEDLLEEVNKRGALMGDLIHTLEKNFPNIDTLIQKVFFNSITHKVPMNKDFPLKKVKSEVRIQVPGTSRMMKRIW